MLELSLLDSIAKNYDEIKSLLEDKTIDQFNAYILEQKQLLSTKEISEIYDTFESYCEDDYPQFQSILGRLNGLSNKIEYNNVDWLVQCSSTITFNGFSAGTSYYGSRGGDTDINFIVNGKNFSKNEVLRIMDYFNLNHEEYGNFVRYLVNVISSYWNGDFSIGYACYNNYLPDGYKFNE